MRPQRSHPVPIFFLAWAIFYLFFLSLGVWTSGINSAPWTTSDIVAVVIKFVCGIVQLGVAIAINLRYKLWLSRAMIVLVPVSIILYFLLPLGWWNGSEYGRCYDSQARALAKEHGLTPVKDCSTNEFTVNDAQKFSLIEITYGEGEDCPAGCFYSHKTYLMNDPGQVIKSLDGFYKTPDLSFGAEDNSCKYEWSGHLGAVLGSDREHIKRTLIADGDSFRWRLELNDFTGLLDWQSKERTQAGRPQCFRTGIVTTNLDGEDVKVIGSASYKIE